jgi:hypothetical protein|tara:strand:+ start:10949 stop:11416 length:468 start_codon:yes stop_codon:yes gene_type:complete
MSTSKVLTSKASAISRVYNNEVIEAVKSFTFVAKKAYGSCALSGQPISKGDKCEMLIQADGNKVTILQSTTVAKGKKAEKVRSTSKKPSKKVEKAVSTPKATKTKSNFSFAKASANSVAVREALVSLALASDKEKQSILEALPLNVALTIIDLTK